MMLKIATVRGFVRKGFNMDEIVKESPVECYHSWIGSAAIGWFWKKAHTIDLSALINKFDKEAPKSTTTGIAHSPKNTRVL